MKKNSYPQIKMQTCPICEKKLPATLEFFHWDFHCSRWICHRCLRTCETCNLRYVCVECAEAIRKEFHAPAGIDRCRKCEDFCTRYFNPN